MRVLKKQSKSPATLVLQASTLRPEAPVCERVSWLEEQLSG